MRIKLIVEYDGTNYAGWQRQQNAVAVQEVLETALSRLTREDVNIVGASRTDAGVHALGQTAHFDTQCNIPPGKFAFALNTMLPGDIRVRESLQAAPDFHARFSSTGKLYRYAIYDYPHASAVYRNLSCHSMYRLNDDLMRQSAGLVVGTHDFKAFQASGSKVKDTIRRVDSCLVSRNGDFVFISIAGKGFLYNMVRILAGTLILIGAGRMDGESIARALETGDRLALGPTAPAGGLTLVEVYY